jgi:hypothetical protein
VGAIQRAKYVFITIIIYFIFNPYHILGSESIHGIRNELDARIPGKGPEFGEKRNICFKKNRAVAFHLT